MEDRKVYIDKLAAQLKEWDTEIQKLETNAKNIKAEAKAEYSQRLQELRNKKEEAQSKLEELKRSGGEAWQELKLGAERIFTDMKTTFDNVVTKF